MRTELQRIANVLGINTTLDDNRLCLLIQDKIKEKDSEVKKKKFCNDMLVVTNDNLQKQIHNMKNEFAESVGIGEYLTVKQSRDVVKKELKNALEENHKLNETIRKYKEREFKDRLKKIELEGVR